jgi:predicted permease
MQESIPYLLLYKIAQLFVVMMIGFALVKFRVVKPKHSVALSRLALYMLMPSSIINAFNVDMTSEIMVGLALAFGVGLILHLLFLGLDRIFAKVGRGTAVERASIMYSNSINIIIPIVGFVLGEEWIIYSLGYMSVQLFFTWSHGVGLFDHSKGINLKKIFLNPNIIAILVGLYLVTMRVRLPEFVTDITGSFGGVLGYIGMLIAGMRAAGLDFKKMAKYPRLYITTAMRVIACPILSLAVLLLIRLIVKIPNTTEILLVSFLATMTPSAATVMQLAQIHDTEIEYSVAINIMTTLIACITMPLLVVLYQTI